MSTEDVRDAVARSFAARGFRAFKTEDWDRQQVLDALRENRRRHATNPYTREIGKVAKALAEEIADLTGLPAADVATVLLAAGGSVGTLALLRPTTGKTVAEILQFAAVELDDRATGGEPS